ncbi:Bro-N domain-containing protein [Eubacterium sp.]|uniref:Bro-N domain-containing protein n=1 Tax=Eubacterium sp. TaxID=142586 RepID=UPI0026DF3D23|nr:Bro-N domain-containing protein [Eubacterium sp.]MDO5434407.1 Bro-N domain-containing protein [Eubacterium sp.]
MQNTNKNQTAESCLIQKVFESEEFASVRTLVRPGGELESSPTVYFVAKDVCEAMDYQNHRQAVKRHVEPEDVLFQEVLDKYGRRRRLTRAAFLPSFWQAVRIKPAVSATM